MQDGILLLLIAKVFMNRFKVGDRVGLVAGKDDDDKVIPFKYEGPYGDNETQYGVIKKITSEELVSVKWDDLGLVHNVEVEFLLPEKEAKEKWSSLEKEYKVIEKEIHKKMKEAAVLLKEANKLAKKTGNSLGEMYDAIDPLMDAMDVCGWNTSSFNC